MEVRSKDYPNGQSHLVKDNMKFKSAIRKLYFGALHLQKSGLFNFYNYFAAQLLYIDRKGAEYHDIC